MPLDVGTILAVIAVDVGVLSKRRACKTQYHADDKQELFHETASFKFDKNQ